MPLTGTQLIDVPEAVVTYINGLSLEPWTPAVRKNNARDTRKAITGLTIYVVPKGRANEFISRSAAAQVLEVYIVIKAPMSEGGGNDETDACITLGEQIQAAFGPQVVLNNPKAVVISSAFGDGRDSTFLSKDEINNQQLYCGVVRVTFKLIS